MRAGRVAIGVLVSLAAVALLVRSIDVGAAGATLAAVDIRWLLLPLAVVLAQFGIRTLRWRGLVAATSGRVVPPRSIAAAMAVGYLGNAILPARLGEVARILYLSRRSHVGLAPATASVVLERAVDIAGLATIAGVAAALATSGAPAILLLVPLVAVALVSVRLVARRLTVSVGSTTRLASVQRGLVRFLGAIAAAWLPALAAGYLLSVIAWLGDGLLVWACATSLGIPLSLPEAMAIGVGAALATILPSAGGYVGTYELGVLAAGSVFGVPAPELLSLALVAHLMAVVPLALIGAVVVAKVGLEWRQPSPALQVEASTAA